MPDKLAALIARLLEAAESGPWQSRDVYADCAKVLAETLADEEPQPARTCATCAHWNADETDWGNCEISVRENDPRFANVTLSGPDYGCIHHQRKDGTA